MSSDIWTIFRRERPAKFLIMHHKDFGTDLELILENEYF